MVEGKDSGKVEQAQLGGSRRPNLRKGQLGRSSNVVVDALLASDFLLANLI